MNEKCIEDNLLRLLLASSPSYPNPEEILIFKELGEPGEILVSDETGKSKWKKITHKLDVIPGEKRGEKGMTEWQPIDTAPKNGTEIIILYENQTQIASWGNHIYEGAPDCCWGDSVFERAKGIVRFKESLIQGWLPLPEPPKKKHLCLQGCVAVHNNNGYLAMDVYENSDRKGCFIRYIIKCCPFCGEPAERKHE